MVPFVCTGQYEPVSSTLDESGSRPCANPADAKRNRSSVIFKTTPAFHICTADAMLGIKTALRQRSYEHRPVLPHRYGRVGFRPSSTILLIWHQGWRAIHFRRGGDGRQP